MVVSDNGLIECRLCGRHWRSLGHHLRWGHGVSADAYRDRFGIRRGSPLTCATTRERMSAAIGITIAAGRLDRHYAGNAARAVLASAAGLPVKRELRAKGADFRNGGTPPTPRATLEAIVAAVEAGSTKTAAVVAARVSWSGAHAALGRHADLTARLAEAKRRGSEVAGSTGRTRSRANGPGG